MKICNLLDPLQSLTVRICFKYLVLKTVPSTKYCFKIKQSKTKKQPNTMPELLIEI